MSAAASPCVSDQQPEGKRQLAASIATPSFSARGNQAPAAAGGAAFRFASCFVCGEKGHISRECPQNAKGIYIKGGCCKLCQGACDWHAAVISERGR